MPRAVAPLAQQLLAGHGVGRRAWGPVDQLFVAPAAGVTGGGRRRPPRGFVRAGSPDPSGRARQCPSRPNRRSWTA
jgi:hypothetical protein